MAKKRKRAQRGPNKKKSRGAKSKDIGRDVKTRREVRKEELKKQQLLGMGKRILEGVVCLFCLEALPEAESDAHAHRLGCLESQGI